MTVKRMLGFAMPFALAAAVLAQTKTGRPGTGGTPVFMPAADIKWADLDPNGAPGVKIADVWGDHAKSGYGAFLKFPAGFLTPLHTHTSAIKIVVISGTYIQTPEGKAEHRMGPGSYVFQPGGNYKHISACDKSSDCVLFIESSGKFDLKPVAAAK
jgi:beta-alanine degradation protein BauB